MTKLHKEHLVIAKTLGLKTIYTLFKPLVQKKNMLCILCAVASMCLATVYIMGFVVIIFIIVLKVIKVNAYQRILIILDYED